MIKQFLLIALLFPIALFAKDNYKVEVVELDLDNGLHVIMNQDKSAPNVIIGVKYHVGAKNEEPDRTGFAHFFEHLLFHGTKNIPQGKFEHTIMEAGGYCNAYTSWDVTYFYNLLPAHEFKLGLWAESERMLHPIITQEGIDREREIVKEEKRMYAERNPLGDSYYDLMQALYDFDNYGHSIIGSMEHLDAASLKDFERFFNTYYVPNNACLVLTGNIDIEEATKWVKYYFNDIPRGSKIERTDQYKQMSNKETIIEKSVKGLTQTSMAIAYYGAPATHHDADVLEVIAGLLSRNNDNSYFDVNISDVDSTIQNINCSAEIWEGVGFIKIKATLENNDTDNVLKKIDNEISKLQNKFADEYNLNQMKNNFEISYVDLYFDPESLADQLTNHHHFLGDAKSFNNKIEGYLKITCDDIMRVAKKYLVPENRTVIIYHPTEKAAK